MRLATYLDKNGISDRDFGASLGVSRQAVHRYKMLERFPEKPVLAKIIEKTNGAVTPNDFLNDVEVAQ